MREYLNQRYRVVGRLVVPLLFAGLLAPLILQGVAWIPRWALDSTFPIAVVTTLLVLSPRSRPGIGITRYMLRDIKCPHCGPTWEEPIQRQKKLGIDR